MKKHAAAVRSTVFLAVAVFAIGANAETLLWYRFDESDGAKVENKANPGTMDGTMKSIVWGQGVGNQGNDSAKFPKRGDAFPEGTGLIDPVSGATYSGQVKSLSFTGDQSTAGMVLLTKANATSLLNLTSFTCECFFKIPAAAKTRTPALFPILTFGEEGDTSKQGWKFGFFRSSGTKLSPWFRGTTKTSTGAKGSVVTVNAANGNKDNYTYDTWHHLALVIDGAGDGSSATAKLILDYTEVQTGTIASYYGFYFDPVGGFPLTIGADMYRNRGDETKRETFMGDIAEFRISDTALATEELLRPLPAGPVDADTLVYLPMGDCDWFGSPNTASYKNIYHGILNAAPTAILPYWIYLNNDTITSAVLPYAVEDSSGSSLRESSLSSEGYEDSRSMQFSHVLNTNKDDYKGYVVTMPTSETPISSGDFTVEWFFKTAGRVNTYIKGPVMLYSKWAKILVNTTGRLYTRIEGSSTINKEYSDREVDDAQWHHYALVYDKEAKTYAIYLDHEEIFAGSTGKALDSDTVVYFGGQNAGQQVFDGRLDDLRITRRKLKPYEFLTTRPLIQDTIMFSHFEGDLSSGQDTVIAPAGSTSSPAVYEGVSRAIDLDGDGDKDYESTKALKLTESSLSYPHNPLLECRDFTVEWFAKYDTVGAGAMLMRFERNEGKAVGANTIVWALYYPSSTLRLGAWVSSDGAWHDDKLRSDKDFATMPIADGKWHHWALVAQTNPDATTANTTFTLYKDYEQVGNDLVFDKDKAGGILALPSTLTGTMLSMGTGASKITGLIDELRITPKVLAPEKFMRKLPSGLVLILR